MRQLKQETQAKGDQHQLTLILQERNREVDDLKNKLAVTAEEKSKIEQKVVLASTEVLRLENQVNIWKEHCNQIQRQAPDQQNELQNSIAVLKGHVNSLVYDNERLTQLISVKNNEVEELKLVNRQSNVENRTIDALERDLYTSRNETALKDQQMNNLLARIRDYEGNG